MTKARDLANASTALSAVSATELGYLDGVTSAVQTQVDAKLATTTAASTYVPNTLTTTTGDIIYASGANTPARLGIGGTGQVMTVAGGVPSWATAAAGGSSFTELAATATTSGTSVTVSGLSGYNTLFCYFEGISMATANVDLVVTFNGDTANNYYGYTGRFQLGSGGIPTLYGITNAPYPRLNAGVCANVADTLGGYMQIFGANSTGPKVGTLNVWPASTTANSTAYPQGFRYAGTSVISSITVASNSGAANFDAGTFRVLGATV